MSKKNYRIDMVSPEVTGEVLYDSGWVEVEPVKPPQQDIDGDEFELDGHKYRRIHELVGNRWIDRCELIG